MNAGDFATAAGYKSKIDSITSIQAQNAVSGSKTPILVTNAAEQAIVTEADLRAVLGDTAYNTLCANNLTALNTALATAKTAIQASFDALL